MNQIEIFNSPEFGSIRTLEQNGKVLFCGTDVATALGYTNPRKAVRDHTRGGTKMFHRGPDWEKRQMEAPRYKWSKCSLSPKVIYIV